MFGGEPIIRCKCKCASMNREVPETLLGRSVTTPTLRSVRRSSELSGLTLVNTSNVVLKTTVMPECRKIFEAEDAEVP
jgi:hypothetical protein